MICFTKDYNQSRPKGLDPVWPGGLPPLRTMVSCGPCSRFLAPGFRFIVDSRRKGTDASAYVATILSLPEVLADSLES